jgi:hypothetical protein
MRLWARPQAARAFRSGNGSESSTAAQSCPLSVRPPRRRQFERGGADRHLPCRHGARRHQPTDDVDYLQSLSNLGRFRPLPVDNGQLPRLVPTVFDGAPACVPLSCGLVPPAVASPQRFAG